MTDLTINALITNLALAILAGDEMKQERLALFAEIERRLTEGERDIVLFDWWINNSEDYTLEYDCIDGVWGYWIQHKHWDNPIRSDTPREAISKAMEN